MGGAWAAMVCMAAGGVQAMSLPTADTERLCEQAIASAEARYPELPRGLLAAIGRVESGRMGSDGKVRPWPFTLNVDGAGRLFRSRGEAVAFLGSPTVLGARYVDIGCMQISLPHHPQAFSSREEGFDAQRNVDYAARFLLGLKAQTGHWVAAVARYHGGAVERQAAYLSRVRRTWPEGTGLIGEDPLSQGAWQLAGGAVAGPRTASARGSRMSRTAYRPARPWTAGHREPMAVARQHLQEGDYEQARRACQALADHPEHRAEARHCLGLVEESSGQPALALTHYLAALAERPDHAAALASMARLAQSRPELVQRWDAQARWQQPADALPLLLTLARSALPDAAQLLLRAQALAQASGRMRSLAEIAISYEHAGEHEAARQAYQQIVRMPADQDPSLVRSIRHRLEHLNQRHPLPAEPALS